MCGLSGVEYFEIGTSTRVRFVPSQPAYAPAFNTATALYVPTPLSSTGAGKTGITTCYAFVYDDRTSKYWSEPARAPFYGAGGAPGFLDFFPMSFATLQPPGARSASFPMVPYAGLEGEDLGAAAAFEQQLLSPTRTAAIARYVDETPRSVRPDPPDPTGPDGPDRTKPDGRDRTHGSERTHRPDRTSRGPNRAGAHDHPGHLGHPGPDCRTLGCAAPRPEQRRERNKVEFRSVEDSFRRALLTNQTFLVISSKEKFVKYYGFAEAVLDIGGWNFELLPDTWAAHNTIVIFKFAAG